MLYFFMINPRILLPFEAAIPHCSETFRTGFHGDSDSANVTKVATGRQQLKRLLGDYDPAAIYNFDDTGLFYKFGSNRTLATGPVSGTKASKERITVGLATNATGTLKLKPVVVTNNRPPDETCRPQNTFAPGQRHQPQE